MNIRIAVRYAMLSCALVSLFLVGVWSETCHVTQDDDKLTECLYCYYNSTEPAKPELLWATSNTAVLRARVCGCWCRNQLRWYSRDIIRNSTSGHVLPQEKDVISCTGKEYCEVSGIPGSGLFVSSALYNYRANTWNKSAYTYVLFCPDKPPPRPLYVTCRQLGDQPQLRWIHRREEFDCHSYTQFVVRSDDEKKWYWLGEASPLLASGGAPFGGLVHRCPDNPDFLCANLSKTYNPQQVQLGVRRVDADESPRHLATSERVVCSVDSGPGPLPSPRVPAAAPQSDPCPTPPPSPAPAQGDHWRVVALVALAALLLCVALLPLAFFAGRRSRAQKKLGVSWQQLRDDRSELQGRFGCSASIFGERPPLYEYDYAATMPLPRSPPPPPLPALPPPPLPPARVDHYSEVRNDLYASPAQAHAADAADALQG